MLWYLRCTDRQTDSDSPNKALDFPHTDLNANEICQHLISSNWEECARLPSCVLRAYAWKTESGREELTAITRKMNLRLINKNEKLFIFLITHQSYLQMFQIWQWLFVCFETVRKFLSLLLFYKTSLSILINV